MIRPSDTEIIGALRESATHHPTRAAKLYDLANAIERGPAALPDPTVIQPADKWQAVARNLAQVLNGAGDLAEERHEFATAKRFRTAFARQCEAHGLTP